MKRMVEKERMPAVRRKKRLPLEEALLEILRETLELFLEVTRVREAHTLRLSHEFA
jgi:hypothetical protein